MNSARKLDGLRSHYLLSSVRKLEGSDALQLPSVYQAVTTTGDTVRIEWSPSADDPTQRSRLSVFKGLQMKDRQPTWKIQADFGLPYETIFG